MRRWLRSSRWGQVENVVFDQVEEAASRPTIFVRCKCFVKVQHCFYIDNQRWGKACCQSYTSAFIHACHKASSPSSTPTY